MNNNNNLLEAIEVQVWSPITIRKEKIKFWKSCFKALWCKGCSNKENNEWGLKLQSFQKHLKPEEGAFWPEILWLVILFVNLLRVTIFLINHSVPHMWKLSKSWSREPVHSSAVLLRGATILIATKNTLTHPKMRDSLRKLLRAWKHLI